MGLSEDSDGEDRKKSSLSRLNTVTGSEEMSISGECRRIICPSCGHKIQCLYNQVGKGIAVDLPGLPAGVRFDPSDIEILMHLEAKSLSDKTKSHPLIDEFIPTLNGENGICYTHPEKLPGVRKDGGMSYFFHWPSRAYTTGTRKRRKVGNDETGSETRWHKTGKTRPVYDAGGILKGFKKILVLYTNYGRQKKPEKTNWVIHQYHLGQTEDEKDGELIVSKVFYQNQPRHSGTSSVKDSSDNSTKVVRYDCRNAVDNRLLVYENTIG